MILCNSDEESTSEKAYLANLVERSVDGLVISPTIGNHAYLRRLAAERLPLVLVDRRIRGLAVPAVRVDNRDGAYEAVRHLISLGHERIGILKGIDGVEIQRRTLCRLRAGAGREPDPHPPCPG